jgi:hypothetical protein
MQQHPWKVTQGGVAPIGEQEKLQGERAQQETDSGSDEGRVGIPMSLPFLHQTSLEESP